MTSGKRRAGYSPLPGMAASRPEWEAQRDDAREREIEKTRRLRAARLAAQARPKEPAPPKSPKQDIRAFLHDRRRSASAASD